MQGLHLDHPARPWTLPATLSPNNATTARSHTSAGSPRASYAPEKTRKREREREKEREREQITATKTKKTKQLNKKTKNIKLTNKQQN